MLPQEITLSLSLRLCTAWGATAASATSKGRLMFLRQCRLFGLLLTVACFLLDINVMPFSNRNKAAGYNQYAVSVFFHSCYEKYFTTN